MLHWAHMKLSTRRRATAPRRTVALIGLSFAVYLIAGLLAAQATEPVSGPTQTSNLVAMLLAATFGRSSTYAIVSPPLAWATRICWAASIVVMAVAVFVHYRYIRYGGRSR
jgi:cytochrome c-type biogenesis protein CcmH/NrfF